MRHAAAGLVLVLAILASCGDREAGRPYSGGAADVEAALETAREFRALGLPDVALRELEHVRTHAAPDSALRGRALILAGDCRLDLGQLEEAIAAYRDAATSAGGDRGRSLGKIAEAYLNRGRWEDALSVVQEADVASLVAEDARVLEDLAERIRPMGRLEPRRDFAASEGARAALEEPWVVPDPMRFDLVEGEGEHTRIRFRAQKGMLGMHLPLPWSGESFRLTLRFRVDAVDRRERRITTHMGIARHATFGDTGDDKPIPGNDSLLVQVAAETLQDGELRDRHVTLVRTRDMEEGGETRTQTASLLASAPLDVWFKTVVEYSRELESFRARAIRSFHNREDEVVGEAVVTDAVPFGDGPFFLSLGVGVEGGERSQTMEISVDRILFETVPGASEPDVSRFRLERPSFVANRRFVFRDNVAAVRVWDEELETRGAGAMLRVLKATALRRDGQTRRAEEEEEAVVSRARDLRPAELDELELIARFDADVERLLERVRALREER